MTEKLIYFKKTQATTLVLLELLFSQVVKMFTRYFITLLLKLNQIILKFWKYIQVAGDLRDAGLIPGSRKSPGEWNGTPLQYSCFENPTDRGA